MSNLKFTVIRNIEQYNLYCKILEEHVDQDNSDLQDEIDLLTLLIEKWDEAHNTFADSDPIELLKALMDDHRIKAKDLVEILQLSKGTVSKVLNYQKGLSKNTIRRLSDYFKVSQGAFNRPYELKEEGKKPRQKLRQAGRGKKRVEM